MTAEFLVSHGCAAALTRGRDPLGLQPARGAAVVLRGGRGLELGEVLCEASADFTDAVPFGDLVRHATDADRRRAADLHARGRLILDDAQRLIDESRLPLLPLDADITLDGERADLHVLRWESCTLTPLLEELRRRHGLAVFFLDRSRAPEAGGCGSCGEGGCGSCGEGGGCGTGGGCSSGSCSSGSVGSADELTRRFLELREQMLASQRVPLA